MAQLATRVRHITLIISLHQQIVLGISICLFLFHSRREKAPFAQHARKDAMLVAIALVPLLAQRDPIPIFK